MTFSLISIIGIVTGLQLFLLSLFLLGYKRGRVLSYRILAAIVFCHALFIANFILYHLRDYVFSTFPHAYHVGTSFLFAYAPLIYFYTRSLSDQRFVFDKRAALHFIPFVLFFVYMLFRFHLQSTAIKRELLFAEADLTRLEMIIIDFLVHGQVFAYLYASLRRLHDYRSEIKEVYSSIHRINLSWLQVVLIGIGLIWIVDFVNFILWKIFIVRSMGELLTYISLVFTYVFANVIVYRGLHHPDVFPGCRADMRMPKYSRSPMTKSERERYLKRLDRYMQQEKPYLVPSLTIDELAERVSIPGRLLSQVINESLNQNFFDFINGYRIEEIKRLLTDTVNNHRTILQLLFDAGFNSKSAFNRVFKKHTGMSPTEYRKSYLN